MKLSEVKMSELEPEEKYSTIEIDIHNEENYVDDVDTIDGESDPEVEFVAIDQTVTRKIQRQLSDSKYELSISRGGNAEKRTFDWVIAPLKVLYGHVLVKWVLKWV